MRYFVSGHRDLTKEEFEEHYVPLIRKVIKEDPLSEFVVGDWEGCDTMFINYISDNYEYVTVHLFYVEIPRLRLVDNILVLHRRDTYNECDASMTEYSDFDIVWIRPGRENSHTAKNIRRRYNL